MTRSPTWTRTELLLGAALLHDNDWKPIREADTRVASLSLLLRANPEHPVDQRSEGFRGSGSVHRKLEDLRTSKPDYVLASTKGGTLTKTVVSDFLADPERMLAIAAEIRRGLEAHEFDDLTRSTIDDDDLSDAPEGALLEARALRRERDRSLRQRKIEAARRAGQPISCEVCLFDFEAAYGTRGQGYIEIHHAVPLHVSGPVMTTLDGLVLLCSNCHRMVHRGPGWLSIDGLKGLVVRAGGDRGDEAGASH